MRERLQSEFFSGPQKLRLLSGVGGAYYSKRLLSELNGIVTAAVRLATTDSAQQVARGWLCASAH